MNVTLVIMAVKNDIPTAQEGTERLAVKYLSVVVWRREKRRPTAVSPST
jgi:hypothetical protein